MADASYDQDDYWGQAVSIFTGFPMSSRKALFDKLKSKEGIPLFRMDIQDITVRAVTTDDFSALSGWMKEPGEDYDIVFYTAGGDGAHDSGVAMKRARLVFIGVPDDANGRARLMDNGETLNGGPFTGHYGDEWDNGALEQYIGGPKVALDALLGSGGSTRGIAFSGATVPDAAAVRLASFDRTAQSFDRAKGFFDDRAKILAQWETSLGDEQASWKGQAAGLFWQLIHQLRKNYDSYVTQLGGTGYTGTYTTQAGYTPKSNVGDAVAKTQNDLVTQATALQGAWTTWASAGEQDPHRSLLELLDELTRWVLLNNVPHINVSADGETYSTTADFKENSSYGSLTDIGGTWKAIGTAAVTRWNSYVDQTLTPAAKTAISGLGNAWIADSDGFEDPLETKDTTSLSAAYEHEQAQRQSDDNNENQHSLNNQLNNLNDNLNKNLNDLGNNLNNLGNGLGNNLNSLGNNLNDLGNGLGNNLNSLGNGLGSNLNDLANLAAGPGSNLNSLANIGNPGTSGIGPNGLGSIGLNNLGGLNSLNNDGSTSLDNPDGSTTRLNADGSLTTTYPDGSSTTFNPATGKLTTTAGGRTTTRSLGPGETVTNPDGSTTTLNKDGTLTTKFPDGTTTTIDPATGVTTTTHPDGSVTTSTLNPPAPGDGSDPLRHLRDLNHSLDDEFHALSGLHLPNPLGGSHLLNAGDHATSLLNTPGADSLGAQDPHGLPPYDEFDDALNTGSPLGSPGSLADAAELGASATAANGGTPLNPMGMGGGMGGMGGGQSSGNGDRVRNVLTDAGGTARARKKPKTTSAADEDDEMVLTRGTATTGSSTPYQPGGAHGDPERSRPATESADRAGRASWVAEEEDVWGTDDGGAPAVIG